MRRNVTAIDRPQFLRQSNRAPFTSQDVAYSIDKLQSEKRSLQGGYVKGVEVKTPEDYTAVLTTKSSIGSNL